MGRDGGLSTLWHGCGFACQQSVLKTFSGTGYIRSEDCVVWLWHSLVNLYIWLDILSCDGSIPLALGLIGRGGGLRTVFYGCGFSCQQRVLKTFPILGYLGSDDRVVSLWYSVVNTYIWLSILSSYGSIPLALSSIGRYGSLSTLCYGCEFTRQRWVLKIVSWPWLSPFQGWGGLAITFTGKFVYMTHHFILLCLNPFGLRFDREGWWLEHSMSLLPVDSSAEGAKNVSWRSLSPLWLWGSLTMTWTDKFVYMAHHFILLRLNPFCLRVDREGWWSDHSISWLRDSLSEEGAKNISWPWLSPLQGWSSLTMTFTGKFVYMAHHFILLQLNPFCLMIDREGLWLQYSICRLHISLSGEGAKNVSWPCLSQLQGWSSLTMTFTGKFVHMTYHCILLRHNLFGLRDEREEWWFYHSMSWLQVCLLAEGAKDLCWHWLSPLRGWGSLTVTLTGKFVYMAQHFILLRLNPLDLSVDREGRWFDHSISWLRVCLLEEGTKSVSWPWICSLWWWGSLTMIFTGKLYICLTVLSCYCSISFALGLIERDGGFSTLYDGCRFPCQQSVLKTFPAPVYLSSKDGVVLLWHLMVNLYIWLTILSCYSSIPLPLGLIERDGSLSTLCHGCGFVCLQRVLKTFRCPSYLRSEEGVLWLYHSLVNLFIWPTIVSC